MGAGGTTFARRSFLSMDVVDASHEREVVDALLRRSWRDEPTRLPVVVTPNVDIVVQLEGMPRGPVHRQFSQGWAVLPDGQPLVLLARACGFAISARLAGSSVVELLLPRLGGGPTALLYAPNERVAELLATRHRGAEIVIPPMFEPGDAEAVRRTAIETLERIDPSRIDFVVVGISFPESSRLIDELLQVWPTNPTPIFMGVGGAFEMYLGLKKRAPMWMQTIGFEWLFRFAQEPRRLYRRYLLRDPRFLFIAARALREARRRTERDPQLTS